MKLAVISDVHSNVYALTSVIEDIDDQKADLIICLGDLVGYGPHPNETISYIKRRNILCLKGNYDLSVVNEDYSYIRENSINSFSMPWTVNELRSVNKYYLETLPTSLSMEFNNRTIKFVHGSPDKINEYLLEDGDNTKEVMDNLKEDILVCAHTHLPCAKSFGNKLFVNTGSVGKPKIGTPDSTYLLMDIDFNGKITTNIRTVSYEYKKIIKDMQMLDFPEELIRSIKEGVSD